MSLHKWISTDTPEHDACLVCGGMWQLVDNGKAPGSFLGSIRGKFASDCTGNTNQCHHYAGECSITDGSECQINPECNCLFCDS